MAKRIFHGVIFFFALYAFVFVPLGKKTALEHIRAIIGTPAAREAAEEVKGGVTRLVRRLESEARQSTERTERSPRGQDDAEPKDDVPSAEPTGEARSAEPKDEARSAEPKNEARTEPVRKPRQRALSAASPATEQP